jgi:hypothetical protein
VTISAIACLDTVLSLGLPRKGVFTLIKYVPWISRDPSFLQLGLTPEGKHDPSVSIRVETSANCEISGVGIYIHTLPLHEDRAVFDVTMMAFPRDNVPPADHVHQIWMPGTHGDHGWDKTPGGMQDFALAVILDILSQIGIRYREKSLKDRFPLLNTQRSQEVDSQHDEKLCKPIKRSSTFWRVGGRQTRSPGEYDTTNFVVPESVHWSVGDRDFGATQIERALPGYRHREGSKFWTICSHHPSSNQYIKNKMPVHAVGELEAALHGLHPCDLSKYCK